MSIHPAVCQMARRPPLAEAATRTHEIAMATLCGGRGAALLGIFVHIGAERHMCSMKAVDSRYPEKRQQYESFG